MFFKIITRLNGEGDTNNNNFDNTSIKKIFSFVMQRIRESCSNHDKICNIEDKQEFNEYDKFIAMVCERSHFRIELNNLIKNIVPNTNNLKNRGGKIKNITEKLRLRLRVRLNINISLDMEANKLKEIIIIFFSYIIND